MPATKADKTADLQYLETAFKSADRVAPNTVRRRQHPGGYPKSKGAYALPR